MIEIKPNPAFLRHLDDLSILASRQPEWKQLFRRDKMDTTLDDLTLLNKINVAYKADADYDENDKKILKLRESIKQQKLKLDEDQKELVSLLQYEHELSKKAEAAWIEIRKFRKK